MDNVKKVFVPLIEMLEHDLLLNPLIQLSDLMPAIEKLVIAKSAQVACRKDDDGYVTHVFCYYHKEWEDVTEVEYGAKLSNKTTGLNTMCKEGVSNWTKQQSVAKKAKVQLLDDVANELFDPKELLNALAEIEDDRNRIVPLTVVEVYESAIANMLDGE